MAGAINVGTLEALLRLRDEMSPSLKTASEALSKTGDQMSKAGQALLPLSAAIAGIGGVSIKMALDFNAGMANVASLIPGNTARVGELKTAVQNMSIATGVATEDLSKGLYQTISAFGDTAESAKLLEMNAKLGAAGVASTADAINLTSAVTRAYGDTSAGAVQKVADLAITAVKLGQVTLPELAASIGKVTPLSAELGVTQEELTSAMATFSGVTGGSAEVSTQLRGVMQGLISPTGDMKQLLSDLGVESGKALIEQRGLQGAMAAVTDHVKATGGDLQDYIGSIEGQTIALASAGGMSNTFSSNTAAMGKVVGASNQAFKDQTTGVGAGGFAMKQLTAEMTVVGQRLGDALIPALLKMADVLKPVIGYIVDAVDRFTKLPVPIQMGAIAILAFIAAIGPMLVVIGSVVSAIGTLLPLLGSAGFVGTMSVVGAAIGPVLLLLAKFAAAFAIGYAIGTAIKALADFIGKLFGVTDAVDKAWSKVYQFFNGNNAEIAKGIDVTKNWTAEQRALYDESVKRGNAAKALRESEAALTAATKGTTAATQAGTAATKQSLEEEVRAKVNKETLEKASKMLGRSVTDVKEAQKALAIETKMTSTAVDQNAKAAADAAKAYRELNTEAGRTKTAQDLVKVAVAALGPVTGMTSAQVAKLKEELTKLGPEGAAAGEAVKKKWEEASGVAILSARNFGSLIPVFKEVAEKAMTQGEVANKLTGELGKLTIETENARLRQEQLKAMVEAGTITQEQYIALGGKTVEIVIKQKAAMDSLSVAVGKARDWFNLFATVVEGLGLPTDSLAGKLVAMGDEMFRAYDVGKQGAKDYKAATTDVGRAQAVATVAMTAYNSSALGGAAAGASFGASFGPIGIGVGAVVGGLLGFIGSAARAKAEMEKLKNEFASSHGGMDALKRKAEEMGISLTKALDAKNPKAMKAAIEEANAAFKLWDTVIQANGGSMDALKMKAAEAGVSLKAALEAKTAEELKKAIGDIQKQLADWNEASKLLDDTMKKYGITVEQMGPKFRAQKLEEQAMGLYKEWQILIAGGADITTVINGMGPAFNDYVNTAVAGGMEINKSMKPVIDEMYKQGKLLHENGEAYTQAEYEALRYGSTQSEMFDALVKKIQELVNALLGIPNVTSTVTTDYRTTGTQPGNNRPDEGQAVGFYSPRLAQDLSFVAHKGEEVSIRRASETSGQGRTPPGGSGGMGGEVTLSAAALSQLGRVMRDAVLKAKAVA